MISFHLGHQEASINQLWMALSQTSKKYDLQDLSQIEKTRALVAFVTDDLLPLSTVDSPHFITSWKPQIPDTKSLVESNLVLR